MGPADLRAIMSRIPPQRSERLLVGTEDYDDAAVFALEGEKALVQTVDFFTPIVDDPYDFGAIAAANALSDIYAMGAKPIIALNIACFPKSLGADLLGEVVRGGAAKVNEAGAVVAGGHTVEDDDLKFGLSVTGIVDKDKIAKNTNGKPGDMLYLTKAIGTGVISTALKNGECPEESSRAARLSMLSLNDKASEAMLAAGSVCCTDVTGFGLLGHLYELASGSGVTAQLWAESIPLLPGALGLTKRGFLPGGAARNRSFLLNSIVSGPGIPSNLLDLFFDPQTSGGLLVAIAPEKSLRLEEELKKRGCMCQSIGRLMPYDGAAIRIVRSRPDR